MIRVYGASWCGDCRRAKRFLSDQRIPYEWHDIEQEPSYLGAGIHFCATCDGPFYKGAEELMVLGGGNSGLEEGLFLAQFAEKVIVVEHNDRLAGSQVLQDKVRNHPKMEVLTRREVTGFAPKGVVDLDERGFLVTDAELMTSMPGVFAAGDVRQGSTKQLASAVGEGAAVAIQIRRYLDQQLEMAGTTGAS